jgi:hypothetical protein
MLSSCSGSEEKTTTTDAMSTDSMQSGTDSMPTGADNAMAMSNEINPPMNLMVVTHKVANYEKWKTSYDEHDSVRLAFGLHSYAISRRQPDSNTIVVAVKADDPDKAMAFSKDGTLKAAMQKSGVIGKPDIHFYKVVYDVNTPIPTDMRTIQTFTVKDWDAWKKAFEANHQLRLDNGIVERSYGYDTKDNHQVMLVMAMTDTAKANAFMKSDVLKQKREESGVTGPVDVKMIRIVARY